MTTKCCDQVYFCSETKDYECAIHGGFDVCCDKPNLHVSHDELVMLSRAAQSPTIYRNRSKKFAKLSPPVAD